MFFIVEHTFQPRDVRVVKISSNFQSFQVAQKLQPLEI